MSEFSPKPTDSIRSPVAPTLEGLARLIQAYNPENFPDLGVLENMTLRDLWIIVDRLPIDDPLQANGPISHPYYS